MKSAGSFRKSKTEGKLNNTLIIYISGDNGNSAEGSILGTPVDMAAIQGVNIPVAEQLKFYDVWGSALTTPHMAAGPLIRHSNGPSRSRRTSAAPVKAWPSPGPVTSTILAESAGSFTT